MLNQGLWGVAPPLGIGRRGRLGPRLCPTRARAQPSSLIRALRG